MKERIGWLGLGALGLPMARNLQESGYGLTVYNRTASKADALRGGGAEVVASAQEVAVKGGIVVSVLWDSDTTEEIVTQDFLARMEGGVHIGMCTGSPQAAQRLAKLHAENGSAYVEAPVFGRPEAALARQLAIPYIGSRGVKERVKPILTALGGTVLFDMGEQAGQATVLKQLGNFLIISMGRSLAEGLAIASGAGVAPLAAVTMLADSVFPMPIFRSYGKALATGANTLASSQIPAKDLGLFHQLATDHGLQNPIGQLLLQLTSPAGE